MTPRTLWAWTALLAACSQPVPPPVSEPASRQEMDFFVLEAMEPHIDRAKADPSNPDLRGELGLFYEANKMWGPARQAFRNAQELDPDRPEWSFHIAITSLLVGDSQEARRNIEDLCARFPNFAPGRYRNAVMLYDAGQLEAALREFRETYRIEPRCIDCYVSEAEILVQLEKPSEALIALEKAVKLDATYKRTHYVRGLAFSDLGRTNEAKVEFTRGLNGTRTSLTDGISARKAALQAGYEALNGSAVDKINRGQTKEAIQILQRILSRMPGDASTSNNLAVAYRRENQVDKAIEVLQISREKNPKHFPTLINLSGSYWELDRFQEALDAAQVAVDLVPDNGRAWFAKGRALVSLERKAEGIEALEEAKKSFAEPLLFAILARAQMDLSLYADAEPNWEALVDKVPGNVMGWTNLVTTEAVLGKTREAREHLLELERLAPNEAATQRLRGQLGPR